MAYKALYRTYRPQLFREVVGQDAIVRMIQNAIANNKISHAYLLCGPRGTGKTTIARIFAKALNCDARIDTEPCDTCVSCHEISDSNSPDVIEIDAASNNGVDEIRNIRDKVGFLPSGAKYKIYIIDEVHMLSTGAFNALLKTLEEPPKHVVFILATTEPQKLPATIISRCQRFDFKYVSISEIAKKIREVCSKEEIEISEEAIVAISEAAEGGLRDALSMLDQAISYAEGKVTIEEVNEVTGNVNSDKMIELANQFEEKDINTALEIIDELISMGREALKLVNGLLQFYRDTLLYRNVKSVMYTKYIFEKQSFQELADRLSPEKIFFYIDVLSDTLTKMKYAQNPRIYLEIAIVKMINVSNEDLNFLKRIEQLEQKIDHLPTQTSSEGELLDHDKVEMIALKLEHVVGEFNKLELYKMKEKIDEFDVKFALLQTTPTPVNNEASSKDLDQMKEAMLILKTSFAGVASRISGLEIAIDEFDQAKATFATLEKQNNKIDVTNITNDIKYIKEDIESLQEAIKGLYQAAPAHKEDTTDASPLAEKLSVLEKKMYELISGELASKPSTSIKKAKVSNNQIALFANDLTPIEEFKKPLPKEETDFQEFAREEKLEPTPEPATPIEVKMTPVEAPQEKTPEAPMEPKVTITQDIIRQEKPNSELVITHREKETLFAQEKQLLEKEMSHIKPTPVVEAKPEVKEVAKAPEGPAIEAKDLLSTYDIKIIERIMHDARSEEARNDLRRIQKLWDVLERSVSPENLGIAETLKSGKIVAIGNKEMILTYEDYPSCNRVMRPSFKTKSMKVIYDLLGGIYHYIALPQELWLEKRKQYADQYMIGIKFPALAPFDAHVIEQLRVSDDYQDPKEDILNKTVSFFGNDLVNIE